MSDYISREEAIMAVTRAKLPDTTPDGVPIANGKRSVTDCVRRIKSIPAADVVAAPRWIPVTERLPESGQDVLVMVHWRDYPEDMMCYGRKYKTRWYLWNGELGELLKGFDITHWMPLPEPPKEET